MDLQELLAPRSMTVLVLAGVRLSALVLVAPVFSARSVPVRLRTAVFLVLVLLMHPVALGHAAADTRLAPDAALAEALIGLAIGLGAAVFIGGAEMAGDLMAIQTGLSGAAALDPMTRVSMPVLGTFAQLLTLTVLLAVNAHLVMLESVAVSLQRFPIGGAIQAQQGIAALLSTGGTLFALGVRFAAPVFAAMLIANVVLAILGRVAPQLNVLSVAFPLQIGVGLLMLAAALPFLAVRLAGWPGEYDALLTRLLIPFAPGAR
jgi:flagellar biosynthetic protein FliR